MTYRDDREGLLAEIRELYAENARLREALEDLQRRQQSARQAEDASAQSNGRARCLNCSGQLLPVSVFAGHDFSAPQPMNLSTFRFRSKKGGFTHAAAVHSYACTGCGLIQHFVAPSEYNDGESAA